MYWSCCSSEVPTDSAITLFCCLFFSWHTFTFHPACGQAVVTVVVPSPPRFLPSIFIAHRVQQFNCSSIFHLVLLTHALALSARQFVHKKKSQRIYTSMHSAGLELTELTYTRLEDNLIRHGGDRLVLPRAVLYCCKTRTAQRVQITGLKRRKQRSHLTAVE